MKKPLAICALALLAVALYAQDAPGAPAGAGIAGGVSMLDVKAYAGYFGFDKTEIDKGEVDCTSDYVLSAPRPDRIAFANLGNNTSIVDTPLEFALLSYYSPPVINIRPVQAAEMLPANDPRTAGLKLGAAVLKELTELRFLDPRNAAAIARYEGMLQFITDKNGVSRAEIDTYYRQGISGLIAGVVDEEFGRVSFLLKNSRTNSVRSHMAVLSYDPKTKYYTLNYGGAYTNNETKQLAAASLDALLAEMRKTRTDFDETGIQSVRAQAALIPSYVYAEWQRLGSADAPAVIKRTLTNFYTSPTQNNYKAILEIQARYELLTRDKDVFSPIAKESFMNTLRNLNQALSSSVFQDSPLMYQVAAKTPTIAGFEVFSIPYRGAQR